MFSQSKKAQERLANKLKGKWELARLNLKFKCTNKATRQ